MLFSSYVFALLFLPLVLAGFFLLQGREHRRASIAWLVIASLVYFGWWKPEYLVLLGVSIFVNFGVGLWISRAVVGSDRAGRAVTAFGIVFNLALLGYYKYANFFVDSVNAVAETTWHLETIILPIGISFFTFQQVAYLVDVYKNEAREYRFMDYILFVTFFPQLIAGPIVHHKDVLPQFSDDSKRATIRDVSIGLTIFALGLFKKTVFADHVALYASPVFNAADAGQVIGFVDAWLGSLAYTLQLYFDFSGYSDMAIGIARMFGIILPLNFNSPYKSRTIADFWRRWHMTLSRFLRDYLYIPLGGNRKGKVRRYINLMATMLLGGLWHGAGWNFVIWGGLHGLYLVINQAWAGSVGKLQSVHAWRGISRAVFGGLVTFLVVVLAWVFFRAATFAGAMEIIDVMARPGTSGQSSIVSTTEALLWIVPLLAIAFFAPNTQELMSRYNPALDLRPDLPGERIIPVFSVKLTPAIAVVTGVILVIAVAEIAKVQEFIYFQF